MKGSVDLKTIEYIIENYSQFETFFEDRFGKRLCDFLNVEQMAKIGWKYKDEKQNAEHKIKEFTKENVLAQLKRDVEFGWEKACNHRGISSELMFYVVLSWCRVLEDGLESWDIDNFYPYGTPLFKAVAEKYGWELEGEYEDYDEEEE